MDKRSVDDRHRLKEVGENLAKIVAVFEWRCGREHNIDLNKQLVAGVCPNTRVLNDAAPDPAGTLYDNGRNHDCDGGNAQFENRMLGAHEALNTFESDLAERRDHDDREDENTKRFEPAMLITVLVALARRNETCGDPYDNSTEKVQHGIDQTGKNRHRGDGHDDDKFSGKENGVGNEVDPDSQSDNRIITVNFGIL
ncbi:hypothetical protein HG531_013973 [Fusarium graminearum]|nr:hypothetical protein HG531_013973 [Fusarium graminearum]